MDAVCIGDDVAVGLYNNGICVEERAAIGLNSSRIIDLAPGVWHKFCIISVGTHDNTPKFADNISHIRNQSQCEFYVWIEEYNSPNNSKIVQEAALHNDKTVEYNSSTTSYQSLAGIVLNVTGN